MTATETRRLSVSAFIVRVGANHWLHVHDERRNTVHVHLCKCPRRLEYLAFDREAL